MEAITQNALKIEIGRMRSNYIEIDSQMGTS